MEPRRLFIISAVALALLLAWRWESGPISHPPGQLAPDAPLQRALNTPAFSHEGLSLTPRAEFEVRARVLSSEPYYLDAGASISPRDLALGWGPMSDQAVLDHIKVSQGARWYYLRWDLPAPIPESVIMGHSGNMHMVPAESWIKNELGDVRAGQVVELRGMLVDVDRDDGWAWRTSLSRDDVGDGSCEIFYVQYVAVSES